jgi:hypothetical protein
LSHFALLDWETATAVGNLMYAHVCVVQMMP